MSNKYLEKVADLRQYGRMAREAVNAGRRNPMTTAFGAGGALDGALSTTRQGDEGNFRLGLRGVRNTVVGAAKGAAAGKALELSYQHLKRKALADANPFLDKAASLAGVGKHLAKTWKETPFSAKASLGISATGLGVSAANYKTNKANRDRAALQAELDRKALAALRGIHRELKAQGQEKRAKDEKAYYGEAAGAAGVYSGLKITKNQFDRGHLTGRETLYHGSTAENIANIKRQGLKPNRSDKGVSGVVGLAEKNKNLVFAEKRKLHAQNYAAQQEAISAGKVKNQADLIQEQRKALGKAIKRHLTGQNKYVAKINLPTWRQEYRGVTNPEVKTMFRKMEGNLFYKIQPKSVQKAQKNMIYKNFQTNVHVQRGEHGIGTEYIKGSKNYRRNSAREIGEYIAHNKGRFAKGLGRAVGGLGMAAAGAALFNHSRKNNA